MTAAPRSYWRSISDEQLAAARDEYRRLVAQGYRSAPGGIGELERMAAEIDDDLARRAAEREAQKAGAA